MLYIKAPKELAIHLGLKFSRPIFPDGNYLLWDRDMLRFGNSATFDTLLPTLGCLPMTPEEVRAEQDGAAPAALPEATDPRAAEWLPANTNPETKTESERGAEEGDEE